ncbi:hypothetical protein [Lichenifustis flavocetrariae]|uniref:Uncharacterized protein n=1 Tax=Lichenifustis flavocetrariae TaxID=2949735 RepID=A0AA41YXX1_9HYPH|nr:hypothetical protein [Lichenifustis flavocetrariae]MCW6509232.1 hypothetical protein [Lichenifustis flavocetrariae]
MTDTTLEPVARPRPADGWRMRRIWIGAACGAWFAAARWILDFWPLGAGVPQALRVVVDLSRLVLILPLAGFVLTLLIGMSIALWRRYFRRAASSLLALAALPVCYVIIARSSVLDPWLWYTIANKSQLETVATTAPATAPRYAVLKAEDVSSGFAGIDPNHFVLLVYDDSDDIGRAPGDRPAIWQNRTVPGLDLPLPKGRHLIGYFFRADCYD